ncbi:uncharacterized protein LOC127834516 [Dreissena polymorpha]|nr:uncharacterized protein LOC127834516 [Dreissena polymorpha]
MEQAQRLEQQRLLEIQQRQDHEHLLEVLRKQEHEKRQRLMDVQKREEQQQEKLMMEDRIRNERRRVALGLDQIPREADLSPPFSLALLTGKSEVKSDSNIVRSEYRHDYSPAGALSSIEIFKAPGFHRRQNPNIIPTPLTTTLATTASTIMDHWHARFNQRDLHEHLGVPYQIDLSRKTHAQSNQNQPTEVIDKITVSPVILQFTTQYASTTTSTTPATSVTRAPTTTTVPPILQTADPNPPPIFDTKVQFTFMPMPNIEKSTKPTVSKASANGSNPDEILPVNFDKRCQGCVFVNDRCLLPDRVHCHQYVECVRQGQTVRAFNRECALGSFFDRKTYICVDPKNADCPTDRCREPGTKWYTIHGHCKHYWSCGLREGGAPYAQSSCCPDMGGFVDDVGCVENKNCTDSCEKPIQMEGPAGCLLRKTDKPSVYFDGNANIERPCAPGTIFNERACTCVQDVAIERSPNKPGAGTCMPLLAVTFTGNQVADDSHQKQHIGVDGVSSSVEGHGIFTGNSRLVLWRYANHMLPLVFAIRFSFLSQNTEPRFQTLISNCDDKTSREPSLEISIDTQYQEVIFKVDTYEGVAKRFKIMYNKTKWNEVALIYDGERIVGSVDRRARNMLGSGGIETRPQPIGIGMCSNSNGFKGLIDDVNIYEDCIPDEMFGIFMSVLE